MRVKNQEHKQNPKKKKNSSLLKSKESNKTQKRTYFPLALDESHNQRLHPSIYVSIAEENPINHLLIDEATTCTIGIFEISDLGARFQRC